MFKIRTERIINRIMNRVEFAVNNLMKAPDFTEGNVESVLAKRFEKLKNLIESRKEDDTHMLNPKNVTGIWYLSALRYEDNLAPLIIVRSPLRKGEYERMLLHKEIFDVIFNDATFDFDTDFVEGDTLIKGAQQELFDEVNKGRVYTIYREGECC